MRIDYILSTMGCSLLALMLLLFFDNLRCYFHVMYIFGFLIIFKLIEIEKRLE